MAATSTPVTTSEGVAPPVATPDGILRRITNVIYKAVDDLSYVEVITAAGKTDVQIKTKDTDDDIIATIRRMKAEKAIGEVDITMMARTRIEIDGDILMLMPGSEGEPGNIRTEINTIHQQNVEVAVENWNNFMNTMLETLRIVTMLANPGLASSLKDIRSNVISELS